jgi:hypothetical protein
MRNLTIMALLALSACGILDRSSSPTPSAPKIALKAFTKDEQHEIADERYKLEHSRLCELTAIGPRLIAFPEAVLVYDDWLRMRDDIRVAGAAR